MKRTENDVRAELIRGALSGQNLTHWLPGGDYKLATSAVVAGSGGGSMEEWAGKTLWYQVSQKGIGAYDSVSNMRDPKAAVVFVTWRDIADAMARVPKYLVEELNRTGNAWMAWNKEWNHTPQPDRSAMTPDERKQLQQDRMASWEAVERPYAAARKAIIDIAMERPSLEPTLF